jgi:metal-dependent hydrolase (beta-lactamase superfamily II)
MHTFDISPKDIETIVLSHGHFDHTTGLDGLARRLGRTNLPVMIHPDFWNRRRLIIPGRDPAFIRLLDSHTQLSFFDQFHFVAPSLPYAGWSDIDVDASIKAGASSVR